MKQRFFTACHCDDEVWKRSSSGGAFSAITDEWFIKYKDKAVVYGCVMDEDLKAKHIRAVTTDERNRMCGSKYISSCMSGVYQSVENDLNNDFYVAFSGTPCQVGALKSYLNFKGVKWNENLLTIEVVCNGVGSTRFFHDYINTMEKKYGSKAVSCNFRAKSRPGKLQDMEIIFENGKKYNASSTKYDWFYSVYHKGYILKPSCFKCEYSKMERVADVSVADSWESKSTISKAKSLLIVNTENGMNAVTPALGNMTFSEISSDKIHQDRMQGSCKKPKDYEEFWKIYEARGYLAVQKFVGNNTIKGKMKSCIARIMYNLHLIELIKYIKETVK